MTKPRTAIRRMYGMGPNSLYPAQEKRRAEIEALEGCPVYPYLVIPDTPAARQVMIKRVHDEVWDAGITREMVEYVLATALTPSK